MKELAALLATLTMLVLIATSILNSCTITKMETRISHLEEVQKP